MPQTSRKSIRYAVVGLGHFAQTAILPAFANTSKIAELAALVTGDSEKAKKLHRKYKVPAFHYDEYDALCASGDIDAVYIAVPNSEHRQYTERAARAGVHVLCEKPLAYSVADAERMIAACERAQVRLMTAYRLHFEAGNLAAIKAVQEGRIGEPRLFVSTHTMQVEADNVRVDLSLGGGPMEDIGIYCLNAARYLFQAEPDTVTAFAVHGNDPRFEEVPEAVSVTLRFPNDCLATFVCGFGSAKLSEYQIIGTQGVIKMDPAYTWHGDLEQVISVGKQERKKTFKHRDQVAAEIDYFAKCILEEREPEPSGKEGLIDVKIIDAIRRSYRTQKSIAIENLPYDPQPQSAQSIRKSPPRQPKPVNAESPSQED